MTPILESLLALCVFAALVAGVAGRVRSHDRWLARLFVIAVLLRGLVALLINIGIGADIDFARGLWGDSWTYNRSGRILALAWAGEIPYDAAEAALSFSGYGFGYFVGAIYFFFGENTLLAQLANAVVGASSLLVIFGIAKKLFDERVARLAATFMAFFPQVVFWSCAIYKDPLIQLCIGLCMYAVLCLGERFALRHILLYLAASIALMSLRFYVFYFVVFATLGTFVIAQRGRSVFGGVAAQLTLGIAFLGAFSAAAGTEQVAQHAEYFTLERLQITRSDQVRWADSSFEGVADVSTVGGVISTLPLGLLYLMLAPFPWSGGSARQLVTIPEMLYWYTLLPALLGGLAFTIRTRFRAALPILVFTAALTCAYAVFQGNVGTAYRQRVQITMFFFIFIAAGRVEKQRARERRAAARSERLPQLRPAWRA